MNIFVTVATHEQPFNRLMDQVEELAQAYSTHKILVQYGYSRKPVAPNIYAKKFMAFEEMQSAYKEADCIITHAGPASVFDALQTGIVPIIVPRYHTLGEHVNNHQVEFTKFLAEKNYPIIGVYEHDSLINAVKKVGKLGEDITFVSHSADFNSKLQLIINNLLK